jgi:hypothetical protein
MIAPQKNCLRELFLEIDQKLENAPRIGTTVNVITKKNELVFWAGIDFGYEVLELINATMNIAHCDHSHIASPDCQWCASLLKQADFFGKVFEDNGRQFLHALRTDV